MISILSFTPCDKGEGIRIAVSLDGEKNNYVVPADFFLESGMQKGDIDEVVLEDIKYQSSLYAARRQAIRIISFGQCSKRKLYQKLSAKGFPHECAKNATEFVAENGYIDERWQIENYLFDLLEKRYIGKRKALPMLIAKGYSGDEILAVIEEKYTEKDFAIFKKRFLEKRFGKSMPDSKEEALEMKKALYKQGF